MTGSSTALNPTREAVRQRLTSQWREKASVLAFPRGAVVYYVGGRKRNGKQLAPNRFLRGLRYLAVGIYAIVAFPVIVILGVLDDWGIQVPERARKSGRVVVTGAEEAEAVRLADTLLAAGAVAVGLLVSFPCRGRQRGRRRGTAHPLVRLRFVPAEAEAARYVADLAGRCEDRDVDQPSGTRPHPPVEWAVVAGP